jgi:hypothetical protein
VSSKINEAQVQIRDAGISLPRTVRHIPFNSEVVGCHGGSPTMMANVVSDARLDCTTEATG